MHEFHSVQLFWFLLQCWICVVDAQCLLKYSQGPCNNLNPIKALHWDFSGPSDMGDFHHNNDPLGSRFSTLLRKHFCYSPSGKLPRVSGKRYKGNASPLPRTAVALKHICWPSATRYRWIGLWSIAKLQVLSQRKACSLWFAEAILLIFFPFTRQDSR